MQRKKIQPVLDTFFFYAGDLVWLCAIIAVYLYFAVRHIQYPLLHGDDGGILLAALSIYQEGWRWLANIFKADILLLAEGYHGCADALLLLPFIPFIKDPVLIIRAASIFYASLGILFTFLFTRLLFGRRIALAVSLLLATTPAFVFSSSRCGLFTGTATMIFIAMAALWSLLKWYRSSRLGYFALGCFLLGFGLNTRIWFLWLIVALGVTALLLRLPIIRIMRKAQGRSPLAKHLVIGAILFSLGIVTFIHDNLAHQRTLSFLFSHLGHSEAGVKNAHYALNLVSVLKNFIYQFTVPPVLTISAMPHSLFERVCVFFSLGLFFIILFFLLLRCALQKTGGTYMKRLSFLALLFFLMFLQSPFTPSNLAFWHLHFLVPFASLITASVLAGIAELSRNKWLRATAMAVLALILIFNAVTINIYQGRIARTGGSGEFSGEGFRQLVGWLRNNRNGRAVIPITVNNNLSELLKLYYRDGDIESLIWFDTIDKQKTLFRRDSALYIIPAESLEGLMKTVRAEGLQCWVEETFSDRGGRLAFIALSFPEPQSAHASEGEWLDTAYRDLIFKKSGVVKHEEEVAGRKTAVYDISGNSDVLFLDPGAADFVLEADFKIIHYAAGFIFHAKDQQNLYMGQFIVAKPSFLRWHVKLNGKYDPAMITNAQLPFELKKGIWYHVRFVVQDNTFTVYLDATVPAVSQWSDPQKTFQEGYVGFRTYDKEHVQFANISVKPL